MSVNNYYQYQFAFESVSGEELRSCINASGLVKNIFNNGLEYITSGDKILFCTLVRQTKHLVN